MALFRLGSGDKRDQTSRQLSPYTLANSALFRRPAMDVEGRAFIRHVAYWPSAAFHPLGTYKPDESTVRSLVWFASINALIQRIVGVPDAFKVYCDRHGPEVFEANQASETPINLLNGSKNFKKEFRTVLLTPADTNHQSDTYLSPPLFGRSPSSGNGAEGPLWRFRLRADMHIEYFTLTFVLDQPSVAPEIDPSDTSRQLNPALIDALGELFGVLEQDFTVAPPGNGPVAGPQESLADPFLTRSSSPEDEDTGKATFETVWERVEELGVLHPDLQHPAESRGGILADIPLIGALVKPALAAGNAEAKAGAIIGERFADFRSYGLDLKIGASGSPPPRAEDYEPRQFLNAPLRFRTDLPGGAPEDEARVAIWPHARYLEANHDAVEKALRITRGQSEIALTGLIDGRALYLSTLGRDGAPDSRKDTQAPELQSSQSKTSKAGDAVEELQPLRYLLTYSGDFPFQRGRMIRMLHEAGVLRIMALRDLRQVRYASQMLRQIGQELSGDQAGEPDLKKSYEKYLLSSQGSAGELGYRTARSQHYVAHWQQAVSELRQRRVEGWQMYDEFIRRRQGSTFDFIARVGSRNATVIEQFETAFAAKHAQKAASLALVAVWVGLPAGPLAINHILKEVLRYPDSVAAAVSLLAVGVYVFVFWTSLLGDIGAALKPLRYRLVSLLVILPFWWGGTFSPVFATCRHMIVEKLKNQNEAQSECLKACLGFGRPPGSDSPGAKAETDSDITEGEAPLAEPPDPVKSGAPP